MSEPKFTPGPWTRHKSVNGKYPIIRGAQGSLICTIPDRAIKDVANSHLIAAAPDLYKALEDLLEILPDGEWSNTKADIEKALAKARGEGD